MYFIKLLKITSHEEKKKQNKFEINTNDDIDNDRELVCVCLPIEKTNIYFISLKSVVVVFFLFFSYKFQFVRSFLLIRNTKYKY